jgi:hypothetical protein
MNAKTILRNMKPGDQVRVSDALLSEAERMGGFAVEGNYLVCINDPKRNDAPIIFGADGYRKGFSWIKNLPPVGWTGTTTELKTYVRDTETLTSFGRRLRIFNESTRCLERMTKCSIRPWRVKEHPEDYDLFDTFIKDPQ